LATPGSGISIPDVSTLYGAGYAAGARVHSNSWGTDYNEDGYYNGNQVDSYLFEKTVFIFIFLQNKFSRNMC
jgi:hypothetical protein